MRPERARAEAKQEGEKTAPSPAISARMHFYAVHNVGEQLRLGSAPVTGRKHDRMVGR
jgi:hypothetical protein